MCVPQSALHRATVIQYISDVWQASIISLTHEIPPTRYKWGNYAFHQNANIFRLIISISGVFFSHSNFVRFHVNNSRAINSQFFYRIWIREQLSLFVYIENDVMNASLSLKLII